MAVGVAKRRAAGLAKCKRHKCPVGLTAALHTENGVILLVRQTLNPFVERRIGFLGGTVGLSSNKVRRRSPSQFSPTSVL